MGSCFVLMLGSLGSACLIRLASVSLAEPPPPVRGLDMAVSIDILQQAQPHVPTRVNSKINWPKREVESLSGNDKTSVAWRGETARISGAIAGIAGSTCRRHCQASYLA